MSAGGEGDPGGLGARLQLQSRLIDVLRRDLDEARLSIESKDRATMETWRRLRLYEMLLEESQRERERLSAELVRMQNTRSWKLTRFLRRVPRLGE